MKRNPRWATPDHRDATARAQAAPGQWVHAYTYPTAYSARSVAWRVPRANRMPAYEPAGAYEARAEGADLYIRTTPKDTTA